MNPCELAFSVTAAAATFAEQLSDDDLELWSSVFVQLGDTMATIALQRERCKAACKQK